MTWRGLEFSRMFWNILEVKLSEADRDLRNDELRDREDVGGVDDLFEDRCEPEQRPCAHLLDGLGFNNYLAEM